MCGTDLLTLQSVLTAASLGFRKIYFHLGARSEYSSFTPLPYELKNETLAPGIRAGWYAHYFLARVVSQKNCNDEDDNGGEELRVAALPSANSSELSGFAVYGAGEKELRKLVLLDMGVWNGTEGLANPSTLSATDGTMFSEGTRPISSFEVATPWDEGAEVNVVRLTGPGTNAKSNVTVAGTVFDDSTGEAVVAGDGTVQLGNECSEVIQVGANGILKFDMQRAEGVLLEKRVSRSVGGDSNESGDGEGNDDQDESNPGTSGTSRLEMNWVTTLTVLFGVFGILV